MPRRVPPVWRQAKKHGRFVVRGAIAFRRTSQRGEATIERQHVIMQHHGGARRGEGREAQAAMATKRGLVIQRHFTQAGNDPYASVEWTRRTSRITNPDGSVVFEMKDAETPASWSQVASDIMVSKYFRKAGVPQVDDAGAPLLDETGNPVLGPERSAKQVIRRLAGCWRWWGEHNGYFASAADAQAFEDELAYMLVNQMAAPNSPQWFNTGLAWAYGITGPAQGHYYVDPATNAVVRSQDAYTRPQPHACQPYNALVTTPSGPVRIGDIVTGAQIGLEVYDGSAGGAGTTRVVAVKSNGERSVYRIVLKNGVSIEATPDHLVFVRDARRGDGRWVRVDAVAPGQRLLLSTRTRTHSESDPLAVAEAALAGWAQGDGFAGQYETGTNRSLTIELMTINDDEMRAVIGWVEQVFPGQHYHIRAAETQSSALDVRRIRLYGEALRPFVVKYGLLRSGLDLEVPTAIQCGGADVQRAYLRSLFQAGARARGVDYVHGEVTGIEVTGGRARAVALAGGDRIACGAIVSCAGWHSHKVAAMAGIDLAVRPKKRLVFVVDIRQELAGCGLMIDPTGLYFRPEVRVAVEDGRSYVRRSSEKYQVLQATLVDTWASTAAGAFALSENNLYTVDAFEDMSAAFRAEGWRGGRGQPLQP